LYLHGRSEEILGSWLRQRGCRESVIVATKGANPLEPPWDKHRLTRKELSADLDDSLAALGCETIDLYYLHRDNPAVPVADVLGWLNEFADQGKIRTFACSNWKTPRIREAQKYAARNAVRGFVANQMFWNIGIWKMRPYDDPTLGVFDRDMFELHRESGLAAIPFSSQANGWFTKVDDGNEEKARWRAYDTAGDRDLFQVMKRIGGKYGLTVTEIVLGYLLSQPIQVIPVIGCQTLRQLTDSLSAVEKPLGAEVMAELENTTQSGIAY